MDLVPFFIYLLPLAIFFSLGLLGSVRRIGFWGAVLFSVLLTPVGGLIVALASGPKRHEGGAAPKIQAKKRGP